MSRTQYISLRHHTQARISAVDFNALRVFEEEHPELYQTPTPSIVMVGGRRRVQHRRRFINGMANQMEAFNRVFNGVHGDELRATIVWVKELMEQEGTL